MLHNLLISVLIPKLDGELGEWEDLSLDTSCGIIIIPSFRCRPPVTQCRLFVTSSLIFGFCQQRNVSTELRGKEKIAVLEEQIRSHVEESEGYRAAI